MADSEYDVIVAGAGPAGSTATKKLTDLGYNVGVFDKAEFPRPKTCGGLLTEKTVDLLERVFEYSVKTLRERGVLDFISNGYEVHFRNTELMKGQTDLRFFFVNRTIYDEFLMNEARDSGGDVHEGEAVAEVLSNRTGIRTETGREVTADYVIGADGVHSSIRKQLIEAGSVDEPDGDWFRNLAMALEAYVDRDELTVDIDRPIVHIGVINWGYGWIFPHSDRCLIGVGGLRRENENFRDALDDYKSFLGLEEVTGEVKGHPVPYGNFVFEPYSRNTLLAGDAAGLVDALTAEGIFYAQRTGELAGEAIHQSRHNQQDAGAVYQKLLENHVLPEMRGSRILRPLLFGGPRSVRQSYLKAISTMTTRKPIELIQGERVYNLLRELGQFRHRLLDFN